MSARGYTAKSDEVHYLRMSSGSLAERCWRSSGRGLTKFQRVCTALLTVSSSSSVSLMREAMTPDAAWSQRRYERTRGIQRYLTRDHRVKITKSEKASLKIDIGGMHKSRRLGRRGEISNTVRRARVHQPQLNSTVGKSWPRAGGGDDASRTPASHSLIRPSSG